MRARHEEPTSEDRVGIEVRLLPGPYHELVADRLRHVVVETLLDLGAEVTEISVTIAGQMATW